MIKPSDYFDLSMQSVYEIFKGADSVFDLLRTLPDRIDDMLMSRRVIKGEVMAGAELGDRPIYVAPGARVEAGAYVVGPAYISSGVVIRHGAYVREHCLFLEESLLGHASEAKLALFLPQAKAPHFAYVGDSILGHRVNLGAGTKLSNLPIVWSSGSKTLSLEVDGQIVDSGLRKMGAVLGDDVETGCNAVLNPGTLVGPRSLIYPSTNVSKGYHPPNSIVKLRQQIEVDVRV